MLFVARFQEDGSGQWPALTHGRGALTTALGWKDQADILLRAREAADALGATRLDRPQQIAVSPGNGDVYCALANSAGGHTRAVGPRDANPYGHIVRWQEGPDAGAGFHWDVFLPAGDPAHDKGIALGEAGRLASPRPRAWPSAAPDSCGAAPASRPTRCTARTATTRTSATTRSSPPTPVPAKSAASPEA